jgi:hypothetical protein
MGLVPLSSSSVGIGHNVPDESVGRKVRDEFEAWVSSVEVRVSVLLNCLLRFRYKHDGNQNLRSLSPRFDLTAL